MSEKKPYDNIDPHEYLASDEAPGGPHEHHVHVTPFWTMFWVFAVLLVLTALTVWTSNVHEIVIGNTTIPFSGTAHVMMAMGIAVVKAVLVGLFFMHLLYDKKVNSIVVGSTIFALTLFVGLTLMDLDTRGMTTKVERDAIYPGGNVSLYKGMMPDEVNQGFAGNIVDHAQEAAIQASGNPDHAEGDADHEEGHDDGGHGETETTPH